MSLTVICAPGGLVRICRPPFPAGSWPSLFESAPCRELSFRARAVSDALLQLRSEVQRLSGTRIGKRFCPAVTLFPNRHLVLSRIHRDLSRRHLSGWDSIDNDIRARRIAVDRKRRFQLFQSEVDGRSAVCRNFDLLRDRLVSVQRDDQSVMSCMQRWSRERRGPAGQHASIDFDLRPCGR